MKKTTFRFPRRAALLLLLLALLAPLPVRSAPPGRASATGRVVYTVAVADIPGKIFAVTARAEGLTDPSVSFAIPAWTPGYYVLTHFHENIQNVSAVGPDGKSLALTHPDPQTWRVETGGAASVTLAYEVRATDRALGFFGTYLGPANGYVNGPAALVYVVGGERAPCQVTYHVPAGWKVASANTPTPDPFTFTAPDYDTLADQPADLGSFRRYDRTVAGVPISVILVGLGEDEADLGKAFAERVFPIATAGIRLFGATPSSFPRYFFHFHIVSGRPMGGLEHKNSTVISVAKGALRARGSLSMVAHEFVHAWNVKRLRPEKLGPFDYARPVRVKELWWFEGVTDYYAPRLLIESGQQSRANWRDYVARQITTLQSNPARRRVTLEEASLKAWEGGSVGFGGLSYYNKGSLVGLLLDIEMRRRTGNRVGLDDLLRHLLGQIEQTGRGIPPGGIEAAASALAGADLAPFFDRALRSTEELPLGETLAHAGLDLRASGEDSPFLGVAWEPGVAEGGGLRISRVVENSAAETAGLRPGDVVTAVDGAPVAALRGNAAGLLRNKRPGDSVTLAVSRADGQTSAVTAVLGRREERTYRLEEMPDPSPLQRAVLAAITGDRRGGASAAERPDTLRRDRTPEVPAR